MNVKPKIALCLSGKIRNSFFCFPYIYKSFINNDYDVDVYIHTWDNLPIIDLYNPVDVVIENEKKIMNSIFHKIISEIRNYYPKFLTSDSMMYMFYSIKKSFDLVPQDYDIVIRCRFDLLLQEDINFKGIVEDIMSKKYDIYIPSTEFNFEGYNDQIAIGSYDAMKIYSDCFSNIFEIVKDIDISDNHWWPEIILKKHLDAYNLKIHQDDYDYRIVRDVKLKLFPNNSKNFNNQ